MSSITVLIVGVTGEVGQSVVEALLKYNNIKTRALVRTLQPSDQKKASYIQSLKSSGVQLFEGDTVNPGSLKEAVKGVDVGISTVSGSQDALDQGQKNFIDALTEAGAKLLFPSSFGLYDKNITAEDNPGIFGKKAVNEYAQSKGLKYVFIYNGIFYDYLDKLYYDGKTKTFTYYGDKDQEFLSINVPDIGKVIAAIISKPERWQTIPSGFVAASEVLTISKIEQYAKELGYDYKFVRGGPLSDQRAKYLDAIKADPSNFYGWFMFSLRALLNEPAHWPGYVDLSKVPEVQTLPFKDYLKDHPF